MSQHLQNMQSGIFWSENVDITAALKESALCNDGAFGQLSKGNANYEVVIIMIYP